MATYKGVKGFTIQTIAGDPPSPIAGQVWYNTTSNVLKGYAAVAGAWASGTPTLDGRASATGAGTSKSSALFIAGHTGSPIAFVALTEKYNGTSWTEVADANLPRYSLGGVGTTTAALIMGGYADAYPMEDEAETYNGVAWSEVSTLVNARNLFGGAAGTTTACIIMGGELPPAAPAWPPARTGIVESWNGSSWTAITALPTPVSGAAGFGISTLAVLASGNQAPGGSYYGYAQKWNGVSWTASNAVTTPRQNFPGGCGTSTDGMISGGYTGSPSALVEQYNGTSWTEVGDLATGRYDSASSSGSPTTTTVVMGGQATGSPYNNIVEEWTSGNQVVTFTDS